MKFSKPPLTIDAQIEHLKQRGLAISDEARAAHYLTHLNYYRLRAYWLPLEADAKQHVFKDGTNFETALDLYVFDRKLRLLLLDAIERIEVSLRTQWSYHLALKYGAHAYLDVKHFKHAAKHEAALKALADEVNRSDETFIRHYLNTYTEPPLPPIWVVTEILTLGQLSRWYENLAQPADRQAIAKVYGLDETVLTSFFHHLSIIRNLCAHHSRLWNRRFTFIAKLPKRPKELAPCFNLNSPRNIYNTLVLIRYMLAIVSPNSLWEERLVNLLKEHPEVDPVAMGFPEGWAKLAIWCDGSWKLS